VLHAGESVSYVLHAPAIAGIKWSGNLYASSDCATDGSNCKTAMCATSTAGTTVVQACADGVGPDGPTTLAEFTLPATGTDFYDVSGINGVNLPIAMEPMGGTPDANNPYTCAAAGGVAASAGLPACTWKFDPHVTLNNASTDQSLLLRAVAAGGTACSSDADCSGGQLCGSAVAFGASTIARSCGAQVGWWTADELCIYSGNTLGAPVDCNAAVAGQGKNADLYGCNGANPSSCYQTAASATCCGCPSWSTPTAPGYSCAATNPAWQSVAQPWAAFVKNACPRAYSFPYDDATSTFTCAAPPGYVITFCPGGADGR
jgi:hypothetical protein